MRKKNNLALFTLFIVVINQNSQIVYKGDIEGAVKMVDELKANN
ncbi:hypothetical protein BH18ACI1_BH18ACI1_02870 [soil metagenome]